MIDRLRNQLQERLDEVLAEADRLKLAIAALGSADAPPSRASGAVTLRGSSRRPQAGNQRAERRASQSRRPRRGGRAPAVVTKSKVLSALTSEGPMTAGELAAATGLPRPSVSTMLSRLVKTGEVRKAERGYVLP